MKLTQGRNNVVFIYDDYSFSSEIPQRCFDWCEETLSSFILLPRVPGKTYNRIKFANKDEQLLFMLRWS